MTLLVISILALALGIYWIGTDDKDFLGLILIMLSILAIIPNIWSLAMVEYRYQSLVAQRESYQATLIEARKSGTEYELAAITHRIMEWNSALAQEKVDNKTWVYGRYVDDRVEHVQPIK